MSLKMGSRYTSWRPLLNTLFDQQRAVMSRVNSIYPVIPSTLQKKHYSVIKSNAHNYDAVNIKTPVTGILKPYGQRSSCGHWWFFDQAKYLHCASTLSDRKVNEVLVAKQLSRAFSSFTVPLQNKERSSGDQKLHYDRNFITEQRALNEYLLKPEDLRFLRVTIRRSAYDHAPPDKVYWRKDVEARAIARWGSLERVELEREILREANEKEAKFPSYKQIIMNRLREREKKAREAEMSRAKWPVRNLQFEREKAGVTGESGRVVLSAIAINTANFGCKVFAWVMTGSHSMFSEAIHSLADTLNQIILAYGIHYSTKNPNKNHPYGYSNMQYVTALISAVGIFCLGAGLSGYHGIQGLYHPSTEVESIPLALGILGVSFVSESITLYMAIRTIRKSAREQGMSFREFVWSGWDPCVNVVLLEDIAAVTGVAVAGGCMGLSHYTGSHIPDAMGSIIIASLLASVASFMIYSNSQALVGRSIPDDRLEVLNKELEGDIMVRQVYDVKGIDMGNGIVRYKAEVDFDGRELSRAYLNKQNMQVIMHHMNSVKNEKEAEEFLLNHGENIVDCLGSEVDRIEKNLKTLHPEVRHVDLEVL
eukprot:TRINITY_DN7222_c0_g1_i1.p1 TRINITY_DN7222_c0_g1~~TRINITY_DN7222_c0_g1_i1.p1  ORF type:complete len:593 (-),score=99.69 TRINITY_DN7222_c0_g1_i1:239-2017(-)